MKLPLTATRTADPETGEVVLTVVGEFDLSTFAIVDEQHRFHTRADRPMRIDLGGVTFVDSSGLACLILAKKRSEEHSVTLTVEPVSEAVRKAIRLAGIGEWLAGGPESPIVPNERPNQLRSVSGSQLVEPGHVAGDPHADV